MVFFFFFQAEDGIRDLTVTGVQTCALPISDVLEALQAAARSDDMGAAHALRSAVRTNGWERYSDFADLVNGREPMEVRDLLELRPMAQPVPLEEVEPAESIVQ